MTECTPIPKGSTDRPRPAKSIPAKVKAEVRRRSGGRCEAHSLRRPGRCVNRAIQMHHRLRRGQGGPHTAENLLHLCGSCHRDVHADTGRAYDLGLLIHRGQPITPYELSPIPDRPDL